MGQLMARAVLDDGRLTRGGQGAASVVLVVVVGVAALLPAAGGFDPTLFVLLLATAVVAERSAVRLGQVHFASTDVPLALALVLLGPLPAIAISFVGLAVDARVRRLPLDCLLDNCAIHAAFCLAGALVVQGASAADVADVGSTTLPAVVAAVVVVNHVVNFLLIAATMTPRSRASTAARETFVPLLPWAVLAPALAAVVVHAYGDFRGWALLVLLIMQLAVQRLLATVERAERRERDLRAMVDQRDRFMRDAMDAAVRERRRVAMDLHDDALQTLLAATQDLTAGRQDIDPRLLSRAAERLAVGIGQLRRLAVQRLVVPGATADLTAQVELLLDRARSEGIAVRLHVDGGTADHADPVVVPVVGELVVNAVKHAAAGSIQVMIRRAGNDVIVEVVDDGVGMDPDLQERRRDEGHVGLELLRERLRPLGGQLELSPRDPAGTVARAVIPAPAPG